MFSLFLDRLFYISPSNTNFILQRDGEPKHSQQCSQETYPSCCNQLGIKSSFSRQCIFFCSPDTIYFFPSEIWFCMPCSYLELHISKGSCSATPLKTASKFLFASTDISFYLHIPFTQDWNLQFYFDCSFIFALEMESLKNIGRTGPLDVVEYKHPPPSTWANSKIWSNFKVRAGFSRSR